MHVKGEEDEDQIKAEPDEDERRLVFAQLAPDQHIKGHHRLFPAGVPLKWDAPISSTDLAALVRNRDKIYAIQRQAHVEIELLEQAEEAYSAGLDQSGTTGRTKDKIKYVYNAWLRYCDAAGIAAFPISHQVLALALVARSSSTSADGGCTTFLGIIERFKDWTDEVWAGHPILAQLEAVGDGEKAVRAFVEEQKVHADRRPRSHKSAKQAPAETSSPGDFDDDEDDDDSGSYGPRRRLSGPSTSTAARAPRATDSWTDLPCPDLPLAQQSFDTLDHLFFKVVQAVFFVYGSSCRFSNTSATRSQIRCGRYGSKGEGDKCPFNVVAVLDPDTRRWALDAPHATTSHDHGPDPRFVKDPKWRPGLINAVARAAVGLAPVPSGLKRSLREDAPEVAATVKKAKHLSPTTSTTSSNAPASASRAVARLGPLVPALEPRLPLPPTTPTATAATPYAHPFGLNLAGWLAELDPTGALDILVPHLLEHGINSFADVFSLVGNRKKLWQLTTKISKSDVGGELDDVLFEFAQLASAPRAG